jgi:hypothetical protein
MNMKRMVVVYEKKFCVSVYAPVDVSNEAIESAVKAAENHIDTEWDNKPKWRGCIETMEIVDVSAEDVNLWSNDDVPVSDDGQRLVHRDCVSWLPTPE